MTSRNLIMKCLVLPIVGYGVWEETGKDAEVADRKNVDVDYVAQTVSNCSGNTNSTMTQNQQNMSSTTSTDSHFHWETTKHC